MSCDEFVKRLLQQKSIQDIVVLSPKQRNLQWTSSPASNLKKKYQTDSFSPKAHRRDRRPLEKSSRMEKERRKERTMDARDAEESTEDENSLEDSSIHEDDDDSISKNEEENKKHPAALSPRPALKYTTTRPVPSDTMTTLTPNSVPSTDMSSSNMSSVKLTPLVHIAISSQNALDIPNFQNV
jgi:hypothetical protein